MLPHRANLTRQKIWGISQNKPTLIAKDLEAFGVSRQVTYAILLARGAFKWFSVRRQIIALKDEWKEKIKIAIEKLKTANKKPDNGFEIGYLRGYLKALEECRGQVRALCHSERWQAPDFDTAAQKFLSDLERENENA